MGVPISEGGYYSTPHKGYEAGIFTVMSQIADVLPLHSEQQKNLLKASFAKVSNALQRGAGGEHNDFSQVATGLTQIAAAQPELRLDVLVTYNKLPLAGYAPNEGNIDLVASCRTWLQPDNPVEIRLEALTVLKNVVLRVPSRTGKSATILSLLEETLSSEKEGKIKEALGEALNQIDTAQTTALRQNTEKLSL
jgi:hypothetical protein